MGQRQYNDPAGGVESSIGPQLNTFYYQKRALIEARKQEYFGQLASTVNMPKNMGKQIKKYHYLPILDDANINDQGIDAAGVIGDGISVGVTKMTIILLGADEKVTGVTYDPNADVVNDAKQGYFMGTTNGYGGIYFTGEAVTVADAITAAQNKVIEYVNRVKGIVATTYAEALYGVGGSAGAVVAGGWVADGGYYNDTEAAFAVPYGGNLYGSSKDVGTIAAKLPALSENGGRVNRVGHKRIDLVGGIEKFGFYDEYTQESLDFDTDSELEMHINREMINAAMEMTEDALQIDLLLAAGVVVYGGDALATDQISGEDASIDDVDVINYTDLRKLKITLDDNRCPMKSKIITGTRMTDTRVVEAARYMYIGNELEIFVKDMKDNFGDKAFISTTQYGAATTIARGEIGQIDTFKFIVVPEMMHFAGEGAAATTNPHGFRETGGNYDVFPMLVVGEESFVTIGFQTDGKTVKFKIKHVKPGSDTSYSFQDPFGEKGFMSIKWYYGTMILRPERIALCKTLATW